MVAQHYRSILLSPVEIWILIVWLIGFCVKVQADNSNDNTQWIIFTDDEGTYYLDNNRRPALYTGDFGDCQGNSLINVTRFDASLYRDNYTVTFHMAGTTSIEKDSVMMFFSVYAYGESRLNLLFNPCEIGAPSLCPLNSSIPVEANGMIPIGPSDLQGIPSIAFTIPDFEGQAIIRIFSNTTQSQIACYSAVLSNGNTFSHPAAVGSILGLFTLVALVSSVAVAIYGQHVAETRTHYAHSVSMFVVFSVLQHIFFTGGLSMNWPSVLVAFWSNYGWAAGMIYSCKMQNTINHFIGNDRGNISILGSAPSNSYAVDLGGGFPLSQLYRRSVDAIAADSLQSENVEHMFQRRELINRTTGFNWYGNSVAPGLPLPGNYSGFAGTLAQLEIPASNAFLTGFIWFLVLIAIIATAMITTKWILEFLIKIKIVKNTRMGVFRSHWARFTIAAMLRTCYIAFFMLVYLTLFQFVLGGKAGVITIAAIVLLLSLAGTLGLAVYAVRYRLKRSKFRIDSDKLQIVSRKRGHISWYGVKRESSETVHETPSRVVKDLQWYQPHFIDPEGILHVHDDSNYTIKFGWMSARFRRSKWWFFSTWSVYELIRACFYGGAAGHPLVQVFGLLVWEILAFITFVVMRPFESSRLNILMIYLLGFSKVATMALSCAFDPRFRLSRVLTTVIGVIIIVIQGALTVCLMIAIALGAISSYFSVTRNHTDVKPISWEGLRIRYFAHIEHKATDKPKPSTSGSSSEKSKVPYFSVSSVRREPKIEDEITKIDIIEEVDESDENHDQDRATDLKNLPDQRVVSRVNSVRSRASMSTLPYGAIPHRLSWSTRDLPNQIEEQMPSPLRSRMSLDSVREAPIRYRASSMKELSRESVILPDAPDWKPRKHRRINSLRVQRSPAVPPDLEEIHPIPSREG